MARAMDSLLREFGEEGLRSDTLEVLAGDLIAIYEYERTSSWDYYRMITAERGDGTGVKSSLQRKARLHGVEKTKLSSRKAESPEECYP